MIAPIKKVGFRYCQGPEKGQHAFELKIQQQRPRLPHDLATPLPDILYVYYGNKDQIAQLANERNTLEKDGQWRPRLPDMEKLGARDLIITTAKNEVLSDFNSPETLRDVFPLIFAELDKFLQSNKEYQPELLSSLLIEEADLSNFLDFFKDNFIEWIKFERKLADIRKNVELDQRDIYLDSQPHFSHLIRS